MQSLSVSGNLSLTAGSTSQLTATASFSDGSQQNVTNTASWQSSNTQVATIDASGLVQAAAAGTTTVTATYGSLSRQVQVHVQSASAPPPTVVGVVVTGPITVGVGGSTQLTATATLSNGTQVDVSASAGWSSSNALLATVSVDGRVSGLLAGLVNITATYQGVSAQVQVTVQAPVLQSITIVGASSVKLGQSIQLRAVAHFSDGSELDVTAAAAWSCSNGLLGSVLQGLVQGIGLGSVNVNVTYQGKSATAAIQITL